MANASHLPEELLRLVLRAALGEERREAYALVRDLQSFSLVCKAWREAALSTPLRISCDYLVELPPRALRWLQRMTIADLQVHPNVPINRVLTHPDFSARNRWVLERLWGAQLAGAPGRWPQFRHYPRLHTLELTCDVAAAEGGEPQHFESRVLAPLTELKHLTLDHFATADLSRLPPSLEVLHADLWAALPLALPPGLKLQELDVCAATLLLDWGQLCSQVGKLLTIEAARMDFAARGPTPGSGAPAPNLCRLAADGFAGGAVEEVELVAQEVCLVQVAPFGPDGRQVLPKRLQEEAYQPEVLETMHLVTLAADFQQHDFSRFGCIYNPDDLQADDDLGMTDGMTVHLYRHLPDMPQVLGFCYGVSDEQMSYLVSEARLGGLALEAVESADAERVLNSPDFLRRSAGTLRWLQGLDLVEPLQLRGFTGLQRFEGFVLSRSASLAKVCELPASLTSLDLCGVSGEGEGEDPTDRDSWPDFDIQASSLSHLTALKDLSLRHFREVALDVRLPPSVEMLTLECLLPRPDSGGHGFDVFDFTLPRLEPGQQRTLHLQLHRNADYALQRPMLRLSQLLGYATRLVVSVTSDPMPEDEEGEGPEDVPHRQPAPTLFLASDHATLRGAVDALTASPLLSVDLEAEEVYFTDEGGTSYTSSGRLQEFMRQQYGDTWLVWSHEVEDPELDPEARHSAGFTMRRKDEAGVSASLPVGRQLHHA